MSAESLSPNQVANLRRAMESAHWGEAGNGDEGRSPSTPAAATNAHDGVAQSPAGTAANDPSVTAYDFTRPDRMGTEQLQALWSLHESLARDFASSCSRLLRTPLEVKLLKIDQLAYRDFVSSREKPSCLGVITPAPLGGNWMLDIDPSLAFAIIDRMLGGDPVPGESIRRPLTEIENRLMSRVVGAFVEQLIPAWANVVTLTPELKSIESTPFRVPVGLPDEPVMQVGFAVQWGRNCGRMTLCIPIQSIERYRDQLLPHRRGDQGNPQATDQTRRQIAENIDAANVNVVVTLARSRVKTSDLLGLSVGDIITTEQEIDHPLEMAIQGVPKFHASAGAFKGKKAAQIQSVMEPQ